MLKFLKNEANKTRTKNYAITYKSIQSDCLDFFTTVGALCSASDEEIITRFDRAYAEDADIAMKTLFFARDVHGSLGGQVSLLGKWLPSINAHNADTIRYSKMLAQRLGLTHAEYRQALTALRAKITIVENNIREKD